MKMMNKLKKYTPRINAVKVVTGTGLMSLAISANAALPDDVKNAISAAKADGLEAGWLVVSVIAALFVISIVKRLLR